METKLLHKGILAKKETLQKISNELKKQFIGLDTVIDEVMNLVNAWYLFPNAQLRPTVINLWGMTGSGKTALVKKLVELLDYKKYYTQLDMGEFESDSASWIKTILTDELEFFHEKPCMICMDEFQFARTIDNNGNELGKDKLRVIWDLLDSGRISYIPSINMFYMKRAETCLLNLLKAQEKGIVIENGVVKDGLDIFLEIFNGFYFEHQGRDGKPLNADYFMSHDFLQGLYYLYEDDAVTKEVLEEKVKRCDLEGVINLILDGARTRTGVKELDLSKSLIFVLGNLDEAYYMSSSLNPDINADELHEATSKITIANIKGALKKRFRNEQVARLGNNHIIYRSFTKANFEELIKRELERINKFVKEQFGFSFSYQSTLHEIIYKEGVFPAQGTRPVLTTIKNLIEAWIGKIMVEVIEKNMQIESVEWGYCDDKYIFVFKDFSNTVLNIYEEKINLKIDPLRKTTNKQIQAHTAVHEAGHAILAALTLRILPSVVISKTAGDNCEGFCMVNFPEGITTRDVLKKDIIISLGGFVAEKMIFGEENTSSGVYSDIENATELANKAIKYYGMGTDAIHIDVPSNNTNEYFFHKENHNDEAMHLMKTCQVEAENILLKNKLLLLKMAEYLTERNRMEEQAIGEMIKQYSVEEWVNRGGFIKKDSYFLFNDHVKQQILEIEKTKVVNNYTDNQLVISL